MSLLLGLGPINEALKLAREVLGTLTSRGRHGASFADVQRDALERRAAEAQGSPPSAVSASAFAPASAAGPSVAGRASAVKAYEQTMRTHAEMVFKKLDANGDSLLAQSELGISGSEFHGIDADGDGEVNIQELTRAMQAGRVPLWKA